MILNYYPYNWWHFYSISHEPNRVKITSISWNAIHFLFRYFFYDVIMYFPVFNWLLIYSYQNIFKVSLHIFTIKYKYCSTIDDKNIGAVLLIQLQTQLWKFFFHKKLVCMSSLAYKMFKERKIAHNYQPFTHSHFLAKNKFTLKKKIANNYIKSKYYIISTIIVWFI